MRMHAEAIRQKLWSEQYWARMGAALRALAAWIFAA